MIVNLTGADAAANRAAAQLTKQVVASYKDSLKTVQNQIGQIYARYSDAGGKLSWAEITKYKRLTNLEADIAKEMRRLTGKQIKLTEKTIEGIYRDTYARVALGLGDAVPFDLAFGRLSTKAVEAAILNPYDRIGWPDRSRESAKIAIRQIREEVTRGVIQGKDYGQVARAVAERTEMAATRAVRIVQTETHRARELGKFEAFQEAAEDGLEMRRFWIGTPDEKTRIDHVDADGQDVAMDEPFDVGGEQLWFPGDPRGSPGNVINCRCTEGVEVMGHKTDKRWFRDVEGEAGEVREYQTVKEWRAAREVKV